MSSTTTTQELFADEMSAVMMGYPTTKLVFSSARIDTTSAALEKENVLVLTMPTLGVLGLCRQLLEAAMERNNMLLSASSTYERKLPTILREIEQMIAAVGTSSDEPPPAASN